MPHRPAPHTLAARVMNALQSPVPSPWYRQAWQDWPLPLRAASFVIMATLFASLCFGGWKLSHLETLQTMAHRAANSFSGLAAIANVLNALVGSFLLVVKQLGTGFMVGCLAALALSYAMCVGLGTVYVRLGLARRGNFKL
jgi:hypothetical protein